MGFIDRDTLNPIGSHALLSGGGYHYLLVCPTTSSDLFQVNLILLAFKCLLGHYTPDSCPDYLTKRGFEALKANDGELLDAFRLHTDSIVNVLNGLGDESITRAIVMDHLYVLFHIL